MTVRHENRPRQGTTVEDQIGRPILLIEDQRSQAMLMKAMIQERWGCEVHVAQTLKETQSFVASRNDYLVALCDLNLPDAQYGEVIDVAIKAGIPSIALTAAFGDELRESILKKGVVDYVLKNSINAYSYVCELIGRLSKNRSIKVLAVDDSLGIRALLKQSLQMYGLQVLVAQNGREGLEILRQHPDIRIMLVDYYMPEMDGLALTLAARQTHGKDKLAIIGLSASEDPMFSANFLKNGANDFIRKPFYFEEVICRVNQNLEMLEMIEASQRAANRDYLTGLYNRRFYFGEGRRLVDEAMRRNRPVSIAMIDIDHFKRLNDGHGHDCGDLVLKNVAQQLDSRFNEQLPARIGGEEFAILMSDIDTDQAYFMVDALREAIAHTTVKWIDEDVQVSISAGIAPVENGDLDAAMRMADSRLYLAKSAGRDRVIGEGSTLPVTAL